MGGTALTVHCSVHVAPPVLCHTEEKLSDNAKVALANVIIDFLLILAIFLHLEFPWAVNYDSPCVLQSAGSI
jgi:hypothetical protein